MKGGGGAKPVKTSRLVGTGHPKWGILTFEFVVRKVQNGQYQNIP